MMTATKTRPRHDQATQLGLREGSLQARLEASYEYHTRLLARLANRSATEPDPDQTLTTASLEAASRQALNSIATALREMAEGRYGTCRTCGRSISVQRLQVRPEARHCLDCRAATHR
jgi:RNA polymerase-binding transcription factor DksA